MKAVITVIGQDQVGILAFVATECAKRNVNIEEVNQNIMDGLFTMMMIVSLPENGNLKELALSLETLGESRNLKITVMHEGIFNAMHRI